MDTIKFDTGSADSQGTKVDALSPSAFDAEKYADYAAALDEKCARFWDSDGGILVHRRFRVPEVFAGKCGDMELSLGLQLSALQSSMDYAMDIPNFLEPWYGIGAVPAAYGADYVWNGDLAPATTPLFKSVDEALAAEPEEIEETPVGRHILEMIEYFLEKTGGKIPLSLSDVQSPLDSTVALIESSEFYMACLEDPDSVKELLERVTDLTVRFGKKQAAIIGKQLVFPGHGFSSSRNFTGMGFSDDNSIMLSPETHREICGDSMVRFGRAFGGFAFHCCGNWSKKTETVKALSGLRTVDGAFTIRTDPSPNPASPFRDSFAGSGICVNARMVGSCEEVLEKVRELHKPGMKLIVVTYCESGEEQKEIHEAIHESTR
ncbi:MAG: hypothetical protein LBP80_07600 [Treponema sp.]|jgi:hypothetical protein|nr:hypothetical protein [Treponema sp.]